MISFPAVGDMFVFNEAIKTFHMKQIKLLPVMLLKSASIALFCSLFFTACVKDHQNNQAYDVVYVQTNNFNANQNAVLAYVDQGDGHLIAAPGSPFYTGGSGNANLAQALGPEDSDNEIVLSSDGKFLLTVNSGSNTIAVFSLKSDGKLIPVVGSPFPSGGHTPVSLSVSGNKIFVVNKGDTGGESDTPNYATFTIDGSGNLSTVPGAVFTTTAGTSPSQVLVSRDKKFVFGDDFLGFMLPTPVGTLRSFTVDNSGVLTAVAGTPYVLPAGAMPHDNGSLGLWQHPSGNPLYVGLPLQSKVGIFDINNTTGVLTLQSSVAAGKAACWIKTNKAGDHLYVLNSGDNEVQVFNSSNPTSPSSIQKITLKNSGPEYFNPAGVPFKTSEDFSLYLSSNEKILYVVSQHTNTDFSIGNFNYLHSLAVNTDGTLSELTEPMQLPVPANTRPKGSLVVKRQQ